MNRIASISQEVVLNFHGLSFIIRIYLFLLILTIEKYNSGESGPKHSFFTQLSVQRNKYTSLAKLSRSRRHQQLRIISFD